MNFKIRNNLTTGKYCRSWQKVQPWNRKENVFSSVLRTCGIQYENVRCKLYSKLSEDPSEKGTNIHHLFMAYYFSPVTGPLA